MASAKKKITFPGNDRIRGFGAVIPLTKENVQEYLKCKKDFIYFCKKYIKIISLDEGIIRFIPRPFQEEIFQLLETERFVIGKIPRQYGKTILVVAYFLWKIIFNKHVSVGIFADKNDTANAILEKMKLAYENLPMWMQQGVREWAKGFIVLENGSKVQCGATTGSSGRSGSYNYILLDEFAFVPRNLADDFYKAVYPVISSGKTTKIFVISTPQGMNLFYKLWTESIQNKNQYKSIEVHWSALPGRDDNWRKGVISDIGQDGFDQEYGCEFIGSSGNTLISVQKLKEMPIIDPIARKEGIDIYETPKAGHVYVLTADCSEGVGQDYAAFSIFDATTLPYKQVAKYRNNEISPIDYPMKIFQAAKYYNNSYVLIETNDVGKQIGDLLYMEIEYENQVFTYRRYQGTGQRITLEYVKGSNPGLNMTHMVKKVGASNLKSMIEGDQIIVNDFDTIIELTSFVSKGVGFEAEAGTHDDMVMTLIMFSWFSIQSFFKEITNSNIRDRIRVERERLMEATNDYGFRTNGLNGDEQEVEVNDGCVWTSVGEARKDYSDLW